MCLKLTRKSLMENTDTAATITNAGLTVTVTMPGVIQKTWICSGRTRAAKKLTIASPHGNVAVLVRNVLIRIESNGKATRHRVAFSMAKTWDMKWATQLWIAISCVFCRPSALITHGQVSITALVGWKAVRDPNRKPFKPTRIFPVVFPTKLNVSLFKN